MFDIKFTGETIDVEGDLHHGIITFDGVTEGFAASLSYWSKADYQKQWLEAATQLLKPDSRSAFITSMYDPKIANFINWWPAWHVSSVVVFQEQILPLDVTLLDDIDDKFKALASQFSVENPYATVPDWLTTHCEECQKTGVCRRPRLGPISHDEEVDFCPSEWAVQFYNVEEFINRRTVDWLT